MSLSRYFAPKIRNCKSSESRNISKCNRLENTSDGAVAIETTTTTITIAGDQPSVNLVIDSDTKSCRNHKKEQSSFGKDDVDRRSCIFGTGTTSSLSTANTVHVDDDDDDVNCCDAPKKQRKMKSPNRFAKWAHHNSNDDVYHSRKQSIPSTTNEEVKPTQRFQTNHVAFNIKVSTTTGTSSRKRQRSVVGGTVAKKSSFAPCKKEFIPMKQLSEGEQQNEIEKWYALTAMFTSPYDDDDNSSVPYTIEDRRYHMVLATLLHARCQEPTVRVAIIQLVNYFGQQRRRTTGSDDSTSTTAPPRITVQYVANHIHDASDLVPQLSNLQYYNTKARYIVQTSQYIRDHCNGIVPHTEIELKALPGIGPVFADLLATINTTAIHEQYSAQREIRPGEGGERSSEQTVTEM